MLKIDNKEMLKNIILYVSYISAIALLIGVIWLNYTQLIEAFGSGPPYYGLTTNMDKWSSPLPFLITIDVVAIFLIVILIKLGKRSVGRKNDGKNQSLE